MERTGPEPLSLRQRALIVVILALATALLAVVPRINSPISRLANYDADTGDPITTVALDIAAIKRAAALLPRGTTYYIYLEDNTQGQLTHDLTGVARLFLLPSLPVTRPADARWVLSYKAKTRVPPGLHARKTIRLGDRIYVVRVR